MAAQREAELIAPVHSQLAFGAVEIRIVGRELAGTQVLVRTTLALYDLGSEPNKHRSFSADPNFPEIKGKPAAWVPRKNAVPDSIKDGAGTHFGGRSGGS